MASFPNDDHFADERELREDIQTAIRTAVERGPSPDRNLTRLESEKLAFFVVEEFDLELTRSWYIAGGATAVGHQSREDSVAGPRQTSDSPSHGQFESLEPELHERYQVDEFREYLLSATFFDNYDLERVVYTGRFDFLRDYYERFAPESYLDAYLASVDIREQLRDLRDIGRDSTTNRTLADFGANSQPVFDHRSEEKTRRAISRLHLALGETDRLAQTVGPVISGTDLIERVLDRLTSVESLSEQQENLVEELSEFFFYFVWKYPALVISAETAAGPNAAGLRASHLREYDEFERLLEGRKQKFSKRLRAASLLPDLENSSDSSADIEYGISINEE